MSDWSFCRAWDDVTREAPERLAVVCGDTARTYGELEDRSARLAGSLRDLGVGAGNTVAIDLLNRPEYLEGFWAALKLGAVPVNVNYRYGVDETRYLLDDSDATVVLHEPELASTIAKATRRIPKPWRPRPIERGAPYEDALRASDPFRDRSPSGDDLIFLYTGGTTGMPKGVMWRNDDLYVALWQMARPGTEPPDPRAAVLAGKRAATALPACPLMHGTGLFITLSTLAGGGAVVLIDRMGLDAPLVWSEVERHAVQVLTIVGDAFARPLLDALEREPGRWDLSGLRAITSSGVVWSPAVKRGLLTHLPGVTLLDSLGASEGLMTRSEAKAGDSDSIRPARFAVNDRVKVLTEGGREVEPGAEEVGMLAVGGRIPIGYWNDPVKTAATFRVIDGVRYSIPGDHATVDADGTIHLLGRGSAVINTGGEKVYAEEVEALLRGHRSVADVVVVGVPDPRFGEVVVALVQVADGHFLDEPELRAWCRSKLAGYKTPKRTLLVESLERAPNGKADTRRLRARAVALLAADGT